MKRVLVANRGEIALRVIRACHEEGLEAVAVCSTADRSAPHVRAADRVVEIGPPAPADSYLRIERLVAAAQESMGVQPSSIRRTLRVFEKNRYVVERQSLSQPHVMCLHDKVTARLLRALRLQAGSQRFVHDFLEGPPRHLRGLPQLLGNVIIEGHSRSHISML